MKTLFAALLGLITTCAYAQPVSQTPWKQPPPQDTLSAAIDAAFGATSGMVLQRGTSGWSATVAPIVLGTLTVKLPAVAFNSTASFMLQVEDSANTNNKVWIGYDSGVNRGYIQAGTIGTAFRPFLINPNGGNVGVSQGNPVYALDVTGDTNTTGVYRVAAAAGLSVTKTVRASGGLSDCTLIFTGGILTGGSC